MVTRIVKMQFRTKDISTFLTLFEEVKEKIIHQQGCHHLELLRERPEGDTFFTYSHWTDLDALEAYRNSPLFRQTWKRTKALFSHPAQAWSTQRLYQLRSDIDHRSSVNS